jgi:uncharacterized membrane protein
MIRRVGQDVHPPFYFILLRVWISVLGDSLPAIRSLSLVAFVAALGGVVLLCREIAAWDEGRGEPRSAHRARDSAAIAILLLSTSASVARLCQETRMYTLGACLLIFSSAFLLRAARAGQRAARWWSAYALTTAVFLLTHPYALFSVIAQAVFLAALALDEVGWQPSRIRASRLFRPGLAVGGVLAAAWLAWLPALWTQWARVRADYWIERPTAWTLPLALDSLFFYEEGGTGQYLRATLVSAVVLIGAIALVWRRAWTGWYLVLAGLTPAAIGLSVSLLARQSVFMPRYLFFSYTIMLVGAAVLLAKWPPLDRWALAAWLALCFGGATFHLMKTVSFSNRPGVRGAVAYVVASLRPGDTVLCGNSRVYFPAKYHARGRLPLRQVRVPDHITHYGGAQAFTDPEIVEPRVLPKLSAGRVWLLETSAFGGFQVKVPKEWSLASRRQFTEALPQLGDIFVFCYATPGDRAGENIKPGA